jgi:hypothetical protein
MTGELLFWSLFALAVGTGMWGALKQHGHTSDTDGGTLNIASLEGSQAANRVKAGPASGADANPTYRALVEADLPAAVADTASVSFTTTSTSYVDVTGSDKTLTLPVARRVCAGFIGYMTNNTTWADVYLSVNFDGTGTSAIQGKINTANFADATGFAVLSAALTAGARICKLQAKTNTGTISVSGTASYFEVK